MIRYNNIEFATDCLQGLKKAEDDVLVKLKRGDTELELWLDHEAATDIGLILIQAANKAKERIKEAEDKGGWKQAGGTM